ncbi:hypothetical protein N7454_002698 [Penicillium verhagenii]|nr:hypothetical protein N7454_002698 [Penicillium verhagenii]
MDSHDAENSYARKTHDNHGTSEEIESLRDVDTDTDEVEIPNLNIDNRQVLEAKLVRKLDTRLLPLMMLIYVLNFLDRNNIATARLGSLEHDLGLHGNQYNTIISESLNETIFISSGALFLFSSWYTRKELAARISILYVAAQISGAFGGLLGSAIMSGMEGKAGLPAWRWLFIIEGASTIPVAFLAMVTLPDYPATTKWLTDEERTLAIARLAEDAHESDDEETNNPFEGLKLAFTDPVLYIIWLMQLGLNTSACFTNFFPTIVATLGYGTTETLLLSAPPYIFAAILSVINSFHSDRIGERWLHVVWPQVFSSIGFIISAVTLNVAARYTSTFMMMSIYASFGCILSWVSTSLPRPRAKRAVAYAVVNAGSNFASIYASYFYPASQGPRYWQANVANVAFCGLCIFMATILHFMLQRRNCRLDDAANIDVADGRDPSMEGSYCHELAVRWNCHPNYRYTT